MPSVIGLAAHGLNYTVRLLPNDCPIYSPPFTAAQIHVAALRSPVLESMVYCWLTAEFGKSLLLATRKRMYFVPVEICILALASS